MVDYTSTRRKLIQLSAAGAGGILAGCLGGGESQSDGGGGNGGGGNGGGGNGGGGNGGGGNGGEVHILTDFSTEDWKTFFDNELVPGFTKNNQNISVNVEYAGFQGTGEQRLSTLIQAGTPPEFYHSAITEVGDLVNQGQTLPVNDVIKNIQSKWGDVYFKRSMQPFPGNDEIHMIPHGIYSSTFVYRQDIYDKLNLDVPETWSEVVANAKAIDEADNVEARGYGMPATASGKSSSEFSNWLVNRGAKTYKTDGGEIVVDYKKQPVLDVLTHCQELVQYSPDPSNINWGPTIELWVGGRIAQTQMLNAWLCLPPYEAGNKEVALNTRVAPIPRADNNEPLARGSIPTINGTPLIKGSSNPEAAKQLAEYMYTSDELGVDAWLVEPMRMLPPYAELEESKKWKNSEFGKLENGHFLEMNRAVREDVIPKAANNDQIPRSPATLQVSTFGIDSQLMNEVLVAGRDAESAYQDARQKYQMRLKEAKDQSQ